MQKQELIKSNKKICDEQRGKAGMCTERNII